MTIFIVTLFLTAPLNAFSAKSNVVFLITITNTESFTRNNEVIRISRAQFGHLNEGLIPVIKQGSNLLTSQLADDNGDGRWDELLVEISLKFHTSSTVTAIWVKPGQIPHPFPTVANIRLSLKTKTGKPSPEIRMEKRVRGFVQNIADPYYQMEGPGIENDKVAFRAFFDHRNAKDVYGKVVPYPVLDQVGVSGSWHDLQTWGMDIWKVGNSIGAGALGIKEGQRVYPLGDADTSIFKILYTGPLAAAFKLRFTNWDVGSRHKNGSETVTLTKGDFYYKDDIELEPDADQYLVSGMGNFGNYNVVFTKHNPACSSIATYGGQAEGTGTNLGAAIIFATNAYHHYQTTSAKDSVPNTSYVSLKYSAHANKVIYFLACWEKSDRRFMTEQGFKQYLNTTAERLANPLQIKITQKK